MSSFSSLGIGVSALSTAQRAVEVAAHNVANANTPGFTRQRLETNTAMPTHGTLGLRGDGMRGMGVTVIGVERLRDRLSDASWRSQAAESGSASARAGVLGRVEQVMGAYGEGMPQALSRFYASWDQLSLSPADPAARASVLAAGQGLAEGLNAAWTGLDQVEAEVGQRLTDSAAQVNGLLEHVARLNLAIQDSEIDLNSPNDLRDQRDKALDEIVGLTGAEVVREDDGMATVRLGDRVLVKDGESEGFDLDARPVVDGSEGLGGSMGGLLRTLNVDVPGFRQALDDLAAGLSTAVNEVHRAGTTREGAPAGDFFAGTTASEIALDPGLDEGGVAAGRSDKRDDGTGALAMSALRAAPAVGSNTLTEAFRAFGSKVGQSAADATRSADTASAALAGASLSRASLNGVNVDEEMVDLVKFQHAYSAASRVITVIDEMLDKIINQMGR